MIQLTILENSGRDPSSQQSYPQTNDQHVVQLADDRDEIRNELDGTQDVADHTPSDQLCVPRHSRVPEGSLDDAKLLKESSDWGLQRFDKRLSRMLLTILQANFHFSHRSSNGVRPARTMHRKPMWLIPVSIICGCRAAGR